MTFDYNHLGNLLKEARETADMKQSEVAELIGCTASNVSSWERAKSKIDIESLVLLCSIYEISFGELMQKVHNNQAADFTNTEKNIIKKYRILDSYGQEAVDKILEIEHKRCVDINNKVINYNNQINTVTTAEIARTYDNRESFTSGETPVEDLEIFDIAKQSQDKL